ncbi:MAG: hypothetical protein EA363_05140 [Balneolaceae bacterium]|nr:MAG: hypothetical protein EA363_05140 [Balneolaceae bacterium]
MVDRNTDFYACKRRFSGLLSGLLSGLPSGWLPVLLLFVLAVGLSGCGSCSRKEPHPTEDRTRIFGTITLDDSFTPQPDDTLGLEGTRLLVLNLTGGPDTLFHAGTDTLGAFDGEAVFPRQGAYALRLYRSERRMADTTLLLAPQDTVRIEGSLPRFSGAARFHSGENEAMRTLTRLERQYNRVMQIAAAGGIARDTIPHLLDNWSSIYWQVFENWPGTISSRVAALESMRMLEGRNDDLMMQRLREYGDHEDIRQLAARFGFMSILQRKGLDAAIAWADSLEAASTARETRLRISKNRIEVLYDSSRIDQARARIRDYETRFGGDAEADAWLSVIRYDVEQLSPGLPLPPFELEVYDPAADTRETENAEGQPQAGGQPGPAGQTGTAGQAGSGEQPDSGVQQGTRTMTQEDLRGAPAMIEVVSLADRTYQSNYLQLYTLHLLYRQEGVQFLTIPVERSPIAVRAFFEERGQGWPVARAGAYAESDLEDLWNIYEMPVRFLIDSEGRIIRKFHGHNVNELLVELNNIINDGDNP